MTDIALAPVPGAQQLALIRMSNSRNPDIYRPGFAAGGWRHNYQWIMNNSEQSTVTNFAPATYTIAFPDGRYETFGSGPGYPADRAGYFRAANGTRERIIPMNPPTNMKPYLLLTDGSKMEFLATSELGDTCPNGVCTHFYDYVATAIIDPYGLRTTLTTNANGLLVTEPAGRSLQFYNTVTQWGDYVIDHVTASDGRTVQYHYSHSALSGASLAYTYLDRVNYFNDPQLIARYSYQSSNVLDSGSPVTRNGPPLLKTCVDPFFAGPMWMLAYTYGLGPNTNPDGSDIVYGQVQSENYFNGNTIGVSVSTLTVNNSTGKRTETRGDGNGAITRTFGYGGTSYLQETIPSNLLGGLTDFRNVFDGRSYDGFNFIKGVMDRNGSSTDYFLNAVNGKLNQITFTATPTDGPPNPGSVKIGYSDALNCQDPNNSDANNPYYVCTSKDEAGNTTFYNRLGTQLNNKRVREIDYPDGSYETFTYNKYGGVLTHRLRTGGVETYAYYFTSNSDPASLNGLVKEYRDPYHTTGNPNARFQYDTQGRLTAVTDALGTGFTDTVHTINYDYNTRDQVKTTTLPKDPNDGTRHTTINGYNMANGTLLTFTDELGHVTTYQYDNYKRAITRTTPARSGTDTLSHTTTYDYRQDGVQAYDHTAALPRLITYPSGRKTQFTYDENWRTKEVRDGFGTADEALTTFSYDNRGNRTGIVKPNQQPGKQYAGLSITMKYDQRNRIYQAIDPLTNTTTFKYDGGGRQASIMRANGQKITYDSYDSMNRLLQQTVQQGPDPSAITQYTYYQTGGGKLKTMTDPNSKVYTSTYDDLDRRTGLAYPTDSGGVARSEAWIYDNAGNGFLKQFQNRSGKLLTFTRDNFNRVKLASWNVANVPDVPAKYDAASRVTDIINSNATIGRTYFDDNLLSTETSTYPDNIAHTVTYTYDEDGRQASLKYPNNAYTFDYDYTRRGQLDTITNRGTGGVVANYGYDLNGNLASRALDNSTSSGWSYDAADRCTNISDVFSPTSTAPTTRTFDYGYNAVDDRLWVQRDGGMGDVYKYDLNDEVTGVKLNIPNPSGASVGPQAIFYDASGNRTSFAAYGPTDTYSINNLNQYTARNSSQITYDTNGNMTMGPDGSTYTYDAPKSPANRQEGHDSQSEYVHL